MSDITLLPINSGYNLSKINTNFQDVESRINSKVLHTSGGKNTMEQELDMNSNRILNLPQPTSNQDPVRVQDLDELVGSIQGRKLVQLSTDPWPNPSLYNEGTELKFSDTYDEYTLINGAWVEDGNVGDEVDVTAASYLTLAQAQSSDLKVGQRVAITELASGQYLVVGSGDTGGLYKPLSGNTKLRLQHSSDVIFAEHYGINPSVADITTLNAELVAYSVGKVGEIKYGKGVLKHTGLLDFSHPALIVRGSGVDLTVFQPQGDVSLAMQVNNGDWDDSLKTYTSNNPSIGSNRLHDFTIDGSQTTGANNDGLVLARATLGCNYGNIKITGFRGANSRGLRTYGTWYSKYYGIILENNTHNHDAGYEANDMLFSGCDWVSNPAAQSNTHLTFDGGTSRSVTLIGCGFDGLPLAYGMRLRGVHNFNIYGGYLEVYNEEVSKVANFIELGADCVGFNVNGTNLITGQGYSGTWLKCAIAPADFGRNITLDASFAYNGNPNTCVAVDTTGAVAVSIRGVNRIESQVIVGDVSEIVGADSSSSYIPATLAADEVTVPIYTTESVLTNIPILKIRVTALRSGTILDGQFFRVLIGGSVIINYRHDGSPINAGDTWDLTDIAADGYITTTGKPAINNAIAGDTKVEFYTYKVGAAQDWPDFHVEVVAV